MQESQGAIVDRTKEHLGTSDAAIVRCRRKLLHAARALADGVEPTAALRPDAYRVRAPAVLLPREIPIDDYATTLMGSPS